mgnify:FL=1
MKQYQHNKRITRILLLITTIHWCITFFTDRLVFTEKPTEEIFNYSICKIILYILLFFIYRTIYRIFLSQDKQEYMEYNVAKYAQINLIPIAADLII